MTQHQLPKSTDILIVGAGPGMTLAISLQQPGVDCHVIDQLPDFFRRTVAPTAWPVRSHPRQPRT
jgi:2-polyprenyl-6-methoxyphenol hydroxylase-like FAD-dependent oxidoreductase